MSLITQALTFILAAVIMVPLFKKLGLGSVLGYLVGGMIIGPWGFELIKNVEDILHFSELGVVFLLFVIGLELQPSRLWVLRKPVFGLGSSQVFLTALIVTLFCSLLLNLSWITAVVIGFGIAMSSTALVLQTLAEKNELTSQHGRDAFAILLFQDLAVIPALAILPLLSQNSQNSFELSQFLIAIFAIIAVVVGGRYLLRPLLNFIAHLNVREIFIATTLLVVIGTALIMQSVGLSMALGAFLAGVLLADSEFRHELEADIEPFKGLLLGLFFMSVGMSANLGLVKEKWILLILLVLVLYVVKFSVLWFLGACKVARPSSRRKLAIALSQGGEFAFVLYGLAVTLNVIDSATAEVAIVVVTLSMLIAPLIFTIEHRLLSPRLDVEVEPKYDEVSEENPVVIAGFGRFGQIVARVLMLRKVKFTALEKSADQVDFVRKFGNKVFYGDASRLDLLISAKVGSAKLFVLAIDDVEASIRTAEILRTHFSHVPILARARNRYHAYKLLDLGVELMVRDTLYSSLNMAEEVLIRLGINPDEAKKQIQTFEKYDRELLIKQHAVHQDEALLIQTTQAAMKELEALFENDQEAKIESKT